MKPEEVLEHFDEEQALAFLSCLIRRKSYPETPGERELAAFVAAEIRSIGLEAALEPAEGERVNAIGRLRGAGGGASLLFNGHLDTNPAVGAWTVDPWGAVRDEAFIYGIGVSNMKAGCAAFFSAARTIRAARVRLKGDLLLSFVVGELQGGVGTLAAIRNGLRADWFVNCEPTDLQALTLHAGAFNVVIELEGVTRHVSKREEGVDAIQAACALAPRINAMTFSGARTEAHRSVNRAHIGVIQGGLGREMHSWRPPQVADFARLVGTGRYAPSQSEESVLADIRAELDRLEGEFPGLRARVFAGQDQDGGRPTMAPFEVDENARIVRSLNAAYAAVRGGPQPTGAFPPPMYYGTDAAHLRALGGMQGVVCGPGGRYNTMPDERVDIVDYLDAAKMYVRVILDICG